MRNFFFYLEYDVFKLLDESARLKRSLDADWYNFEEESTEIFLDVLDADIWSTDKYFLKWIGKLNELYIAKLVFWKYISKSDFCNDNDKHTWIQRRRKTVEDIFESELFQLSLELRRNKFLDCFCNSSLNPIYPLHKCDLPFWIWNVHETSTFKFKNNLEKQTKTKIRIQLSNSFENQPDNWTKSQRSNCFHWNKFVVYPNCII